VRIVPNLNLRRAEVGEQDFRDFSRLLPMKENRAQSADPIRANPMAIGQEGIYVNQYIGRINPE
jgi:hypothetical protein